MIRLVMPKDVFKIADLAAAAHAAGRYKALNFNRKKVINGLLWLMASSSLVGYVEDKKDRLVGAVVGYVDSYFFGDDYLLVDRGFFVLPEHRKGKTGSKLLKAYVAAGKTLGVKEICLSETLSDDPNALDLLAKKAGFSKVGSLYRVTV